MDIQKHWENVYLTKQAHEVSWFQPKPEVSIDLICTYAAKEAKIIDIGGGDSLLVDNLLALGYTNLTVLDISEAAINKAKQRLGKQADQVKWLVANVLDIDTLGCYDIWHDRAAFHFFTEPIDVSSYVAKAEQKVCENGYCIVSTFSDEGPEKCSGLFTKRYSQEDLCSTFAQYFNKIKCFEHKHTTPFDSVQSFTFCTFQKH